MQQMNFEYNNDWGPEYPDGPEALGRNGYMKCRGFTFMRFKQGQVIRVYPRTSKGNDGKCFMEVPIEKLDEFIEKLNQTKGEK